MKMARGKDFTKMYAHEQRGALAVAAMGGRIGFLRGQSNPYGAGKLYDAWRLGFEAEQNGR